MAEDEVGYKRPPSHTRFQLGKSGNPDGRPKASKNFKTVFDRELNERVPITENGRPKRITKRDAIAKRLVNGAANGDLKAAQVVLNQDRLYEDNPAGGPSIEIFDKPALHLVFDNIVRRIRQMEPLEGLASPENAVSTEAVSTESAEDHSESASTDTQEVTEDGH